MSYGTLESTRGGKSSISPCCGRAVDQIQDEHTRRWSNTNQARKEACHE